MIRKLGLFCTGLVLCGWAFHALSAWPSALFYRTLMDKGGVAMNEALAKHVPPGVSERLNIPYDWYEPPDPVRRLDLYRPQNSEGKVLPLIVWIHGGGFLSGSKDQIANYLRILASHGYAVAGIDYAIAPARKYPGPVYDASAALAFLKREASPLGVDASKIVLAGDSAGAQIAAQTALVISSPDYAKRIGIPGPISQEALKGAILHCGLHDPEHLNAESGFVQATTRAYFGVKSLAGDPRVKDFSIVANVGPEFPPIFISAGNADPLEPHSRKLAEVAAAKGVAVDALFFPKDYAPPLQHEYQFNLDGEAGRTALDRMLAFLKARLG